MTLNCRGTTKGIQKMVGLTSGTRHPTTARCALKTTTNSVVRKIIASTLLDISKDPRDVGLFLRTKGVAGLLDEFSDSGTEGLPFGHTPLAIEKGHKSTKCVATRSEPLYFITPFTS
jgi:hypothetical protein